MFHQLQCMRSFVAVAEAGSFTRAAHALKAAPASLSEHVTSLERHLGASLLHRTTRTLRLTAEGRTYLTMCRAVLGQIEDTERTLSPSGNPQNLSGVLNVELSDGVDAFLLPAIGAFRQAHPGVELRLLGTSRQFDPVPGNAEVTIRSVPPQAPDGTARRAGLTRTIFLAAPAYLDRHGTPLTPDDLPAHACIGYVDPSSARLWEWYFADGDRSFSRALPCPLAMSRGELRRQAAAAGLGIINDIAHFVAPFVADGRLVPILDRWTMPQPICHIVLNRDRYHPARTQAFVAHIEQWLAQVPADPFAVSAT